MPNATRAFPRKRVDSEEQHESNLELHNRLWRCHGIAGFMTLITVSAGRCQFCHRTADDVAHILAGDSGFICDECVRTCAALLETQASVEAPSLPAARSIFQPFTH